MTDEEREVHNTKCRNRYRNKVGIPLDTPVYKPCKKSGYIRFSNAELILILNKTKKKVEEITSILLERRKNTKGELK